MNAREEGRAFTAALLAESDRGCALIGAAYLDSDLRRLLHAKFTAESGITDKDAEAMFEGDSAPLGTFSGRAKAAQALGLIGRHERLALDRLRKVRNEFAHSEGILPLPLNLLDLAIGHIRDAFIEIADLKGEGWEEVRAVADDIPRLVGDLQFQLPGEDYETREGRGKLLFVVAYLRTLLRARWFMLLGGPPSPTPPDPPAARP